MSMTFDRVGALVRSGEVRISDHGYEEMSDEDILARDVLIGVFDGVVVEDYPLYPKGPCVLVLQILTSSRSTLFGEFQRIYRHRRLLSRRTDRIPILWSEDFTRRKT